LIKIACISPDDLSTLIFCKTLSRLLIQYHNVELVTISGHVEGLSPETYKEEINHEILSRHIDIPMNRFISPIKDFIYFFRLYRTMRQERFITVVTFTTKPNIIGQFAAFLAGVPFRVMAVRGLGRMFNTVATVKERVQQWIITVFYKYTCRLANKIWFTNRGDLQDFLSFGFIDENKLFVTKNAVDLEDFCIDNIDPVDFSALLKELELDEDNQVVIMVARLIKQKGILEFTEAAIQLYERLPHLRFLLVAPEEPFNSSMISPELIRRMEENSNLTWLGFRKDVRELYALSDLAVLPSYYREGGYPRALLEAMAYGKPVIAADTPECRGPVKNGYNGYLVPPRNSKALALAIEKIVSNPALSREMGKHSLTRMQNLFDDKLVFTALIREVLLPSHNHI